MKGIKGAIAVSKILGLILVLFVVVLVIIMSIFGLSSIKEIVFDMIDTFINFLGVG